MAFSLPPAKASASSHVASRNTSITRVGSIVKSPRFFGASARRIKRLRQAMRMVRVVEAVAALDAQASVVGRAVSPFDIEDLVVLDVVGELAADAAIRAHRFDLLVGHGERGVARRHQRAGRAGLHAFAAGDAGRCAHRIVHVEDDLRVLAAEGQADDVVDLLVAAGAQAACALDAGVEVDRDRGVRHVLRRLRARGEARLADAEFFGPLVELVVARVVALGHVGQQQFEHHLLRALHALAGRRDLHAGAGAAAARGRQHALAVDLDHAGAAVADRVEPGLVAKVWDLDAFALGDFDERLARQRAETSRPSSLKVMVSRAVISISCGKYFTTQSIGFGAAWPSPQIDASRITADRSASSGKSHFVFLDQQRGFGRAVAARRALPARLVREETHHVARGGDGAVLVRQHDHRGRADEAAVRLARCRSRAGCRPSTPAGCRPTRRRAGSRRACGRRPCRRSIRRSARAA